MGKGVEEDAKKREEGLVIKEKSFKGKGGGYPLVEEVKKNQWNMEMLKIFSKKITCVILTLCYLVQ